MSEVTRGASSVEIVMVTNNKIQDPKIDVEEKNLEEAVVVEISRTKEEIVAKEAAIVVEMKKQKETNTNTTKIILKK
jgi:hypothetical protein